MRDEKWIDINKEEDIDYLMDKFGYFHDGCIKELKYISGQYVSDNLSMHPVNTLRNVRVVFQRQWKEPSVVEIEFLGLIRLNLAPVNENYTGEILHGFMEFNNGRIYWAEDNEFEIDKIDIDPNYTKITWIISEKARWREADEYIGEEEVYVARNKMFDA